MPEVLLHPDVDDWLDDAPADVEEQIRKKLREAGDRPEFLLIVSVVTIYRSNRTTVRGCSGKDLQPSL